MVRFLRSIILIVMVFILTIPGTVLAVEAGNGTIEGKLANGTAGGSSVADQEVALKTFRNDTETASALARTDTEGRFVFQGLATSPDYSYQITLTYQEAEYSGDIIKFDAGETSKYSEVTVYDATMSAEALKVTTAYMVVYVDPEMGGLCVEEYFLFVNESDRTYIGSGEITATGTRKTLAFSLLSKATQLEYGGELMQCCILSSENGFVDTMPIMPGERELVYSYHVDNKDPEYAFSLPVNYPTDSYALLIESPNVQVAGGRFVQAEPALIQDSQFSHFIGNNLVPGDTVAAQISGLPKSANQSSLIWVLLALVGLGAGFAFLYLRSRQRPQPVRVVSRARQEESLLANLARLDDDFESGRIAEATYRRVRAQKKAELVKLTQGSKKKSAKG